MTPSSTISGAAPAGRGDDRCAGGQRLDHHHTERLRPSHRVEQTEGIAQELVLAGTGDLADELDVAAEQGAHLLLEVLVLGLLAELCRDLERHARLARDADRRVDALVRAHASEEQRVATAAGADGELARVDPVVDHAGDGDLSAPSRPGAARWR